MARIYFQSKHFREYVKVQTCTWRRLGYTDCDGTIDPQHDPPLSGQESDDLDCIPMCRKHHNLHKQAPKLYRSVITEAVLTATKHSMITGFLRALDLETEKSKITVRAKPKADNPERGAFRKPEPNSKRKKNSKLNAYNWQQPKE